MKVLSCNTQETVKVDEFPLTYGDIIKTEYIVQSPIFGYSGMGYESRNYFHKYFDNEIDARKYLMRCNKCYKINEALRRGEKPFMSDREEVFTREMEENVSFQITGLSKLFKRETVDTEIDCRIPAQK